MTMRMPRRRRSTPVSSTSPHHEVALDGRHHQQLERRRAAAARLVEPASTSAHRVAAAPAAYLLAHASSDIARHCDLLAPVPRADEVRVDVTPGRRPGVWHLDVGARDQPGLLASITGGLADAGIDVVQAVIATWADGAALEAFVVRSTVAPDPVALQARLEASLGAPLRSTPIEAVVSFDGEASPLYTACTIEAPDRHGLLHAVAVAIAAAGADVHAARVSTVDRMARDHFDLSDREGHKLGPAMEADIRRRLLDGIIGAQTR